MGVISNILDLLFPQKCIFCGRFLKGDEKDICKKCENSAMFIDGAAAVTEGDYFSDCRSVLKYEGDVRKSVLRYKFKGASGYAEYYGSLLARCIEKNYSGEYDYISWVPLSEKRKVARGYDQAFLLATAAAVNLDDVAVETLKKTTHVQAQSSLNDHASRKANVMGVYEATDAELVDGKRILLIDDIVTTGATLSECARMLLMAGADRVICATLAKA